MTSAALWVHGTEVGSFRGRTAAAETVGRCDEAEVAAAAPDQSTEIESTAVEGMEERRVQVHSRRIHGGLVVGGDDKRQDRRWSWCLSVGLLVKPWTALG